MSCPVRIKLGSGAGRWYDGSMEDNVIGLPQDLIAKAAVEAWWVASANYVGTYDITTPNSRVHNMRWEGDFFHCAVDNGRTLITVDFSRAGGPW